MHELLMLDKLDIENFLKFNNTEHNMFHVVNLNMPNERYITHTLQTQFFLLKILK